MFDCLIVFSRFSGFRFGWGGGHGARRYGCLVALVEWWFGAIKLVCGGGGFGVGGGVGHRWAIIARGVGEVLASDVTLWSLFGGSFE